MGPPRRSVVGFAPTPIPLSIAAIPVISRIQPIVNDLTSVVGHRTRGEATDGRQTTRGLGDRQ